MINSRKSEIHPSKREETIVSSEGLKAPHDFEILFILFLILVV